MDSIQRKRLIIAILITTITLGICAAAIVVYLNTVSKVPDSNRPQNQSQTECRVVNIYESGSTTALAADAILDRSKSYQISAEFYEPGEADASNPNSPEILKTFDISSPGYDKVTVTRGAETVESNSVLKVNFDTDDLKDSNGNGLPESTSKTFTFAVTGTTAVKAISCPAKTFNLEGESEVPNPPTTPGEEPTEPGEEPTEPGEEPEVPTNPTPGEEPEIPTTDERSDFKVTMTGGVCVEREDGSNQAIIRIGALNQKTIFEDIEKVVHKLPIGFTYVAGSTKINNQPVADSLLLIEPVGESTQLTWSTEDGWSVAPSLSYTLEFSVEAGPNAVTGAALHEVVITPVNVPEDFNSLRAEFNVEVAQNCETTSVPETGLFDTFASRIALGVLIIGIALYFYGSSLSYKVSSQIADKANMAGLRLIKPREYFEEKVKRSRDR